MQWKWSLEQFLTNSKEYKSDLVLREADGLGLKDAATRNLDKQRSILREPDRFRALLQEMPRGEPSDLPYVEEALKTIKGLLNVHRGELREWFGGWEVVYAPLPDKHDNPGMWHDQFFPPDAADPGAISTVLSKPASGGGHLVRVAIVIGLADLFFDYGQVNSAAELYELWEKLRVFAHRRPDTISRKMPAFGGRGSEGRVGVGHSEDTVTGTVGGVTGTVGGVTRTGVTGTVGRGEKASQTINR